MPRLARFVMPGHLHHVTQRGNYRQIVFCEDQDRAVYLKYLNENARKNAVDIFAYCLMNNHVHFIVRPKDSDAMARTFRVTHQRYALYMNKRENQLGHLWQSRYYSCVLLGSHIATAVRYVEQNPVRAGMTARPWDYVWSSARARLGKEYKIVRLSDIAEYIKVASWKDFLMEENSVEDVGYLRNCTQQGRVFGPKKDVQALEERMCKTILLRPKGRPRKR